MSAPPYPTPFHVPNSFFFNVVVTFKGIHIKKTKTKQKNKTKNKQKTEKKQNKKKTKQNKTKQKQTNKKPLITGHWTSIDLSLFFFFFILFFIPLEVLAWVINDLVFVKDSV